MRSCIRAIPVIIGLAGATVWSNAAVADNLLPGERSSQIAAVPVPHITLASVSDLRVGLHPDKTRVVLDISHPVAYSYQLSSNGEVVFIDLPRVKWRAQPFTARHNKGLVTEFKFAPSGGRGGRLSILTGAPVSLAKPFLLPPSGGHGYRLVVDMLARKEGFRQAAYSAPAKRVNGQLGPLHHAVYKPREPFSEDRNEALAARAVRSSERAPEGRRQNPGEPGLHAQDQGPGTSNPYLKAIERTDPGHAPNADEGGGFIDIPGLYAKGGLGLTFVSEATNSGTGNNNDAEYEFGYLISGGLGIDLQNNLRFEAEMNYHKSDLQSMVGTASSTAVSTGNMGGDLTALTIMGNLAYDFRNQTRFTPFVMGGLGLARLALNDTSANGVVVANASDWVYAMQIGGGVSLDLTEKWSLEAAYRYMETGDPSYGDANATPFESEYASHNFLMGAKYKF